MHELKEIVLDFIDQIKQADFYNNSDVKLLYDRAKEIETQLVTLDYNGNPSNINHLLDVTEKLDDIRITTPLAVRAYRLKSLGAMRFIGKKYPGEKAAREEWKELKISLGKNLRKKVLSGFLIAVTGGRSVIRITVVIQIKWDTVLVISASL